MSLGFNYLVDELPDPGCARYRLVAGGEVHQVIWKDWERLVRIIGHNPPGSIELAIRAVFSPDPADGVMQSRLRFFLSLQSTRKDLLESTRLLVEQGPLSRFYHFKRCEAPDAEIDDLPAVCEVIRRADGLTPLHGPDQNDRVPEAYYMIRPFSPVEDNDWLALDGILHRTREPVCMELAITPADVSPELNAHTGYLAHLQAINRSWDDDDFNIELPSEILSAEPGDPLARRPIQQIKPLRLPDPLADDVLRAQQRFHENLRSPHLFFNLRVRSSSRSTARLIAAVMAESAFEEGSYRIIDRDGVEADLSRLERLYPRLERLSTLATVDELKGAARLPIASYTSPRCIRKNTDPRFDPGEDLIVLGHDQELIDNQDRNIDRAARLGLRLKDSTKHVFVPGVSGYGKTTATHNMVYQFNRRNIPVLIFEPVKTEHRFWKSLRRSGDPEAKKLAQSLRVFTPGNDSISPFRLNPLQPEPGIGVDEHIGNRMICFQGAFPSLPMMPALLEEGLERVYGSRDPVNDPPTIPELSNMARKVLREKGYSGETDSDIRAALDVRLGSLTRGSMGRVFQSRFSVPSVRELISAPTLIEMEQLSRDHASLLILFMLTAIRERLITSSLTSDRPRLAIVIEEAHNLVGRTGPARASEEAADPRAFAAEAVCRMLVEFRALGVAVIIVDQHPSAVAPEVIKATTTKLALRQVDEQDREDLGAAMLMGPMEMEEMARLEVGEAYLYTDGLYAPRRIRTIDLESRLGIGRPVLRDRIVPLIKDEDWYRQAALRRAEVELGQLKEAMDAYDREWLKSVNRLMALLEAAARLDRTDPPSDMKHREAIGSEARSLGQSMERCYRDFFRGPYTRFLPETNPAGFEDRDVQAFREALVDRFEVIKAGFDQGIGMLDDLVTRAATGVQGGSDHG